MYGNVMIDGEAARLEMARVERRAAEAWRYRHLKSREVQLLTAGARVVIGFLGKRLRALRAGSTAGPAREQLSY